MHMAGCGSDVLVDSKPGRKYTSRGTARAAKQRERVHKRLSFELSAVLVAFVSGGLRWLRLRPRRGSISTIRGAVSLPIFER